MTHYNAPPLGAAAPTGRRSLKEDILPQPPGLTGRPYFAFLVLGAILAVSLAAWAVAPARAVIGWMEEGGAIETLTVALYAAAACHAVVATAGRRGRRSSGAALAVLLAAFAGRELDWHIAFTGTSMLRASYYYGSAPLAHRLASLLAVLVLAGCAALLARRHARQVLAGLPRVPAACTAATVLATMLLTKLVDRSVSVVSEGLGIQTLDWVRALQLAVEEPLELGLPVLVSVGLLQLRLADGFGNQ